MHFQTLATIAMPAVAMAAALPQDSVQIVGGVPAQQGDFPFIVSLQTGGSHFCGGSLLNSTTVLTAAHCAQAVSATSVTIRAGSLDRAFGGVTSKVTSSKIHPSFSASTLDNDVAIMKLATPIQASSTISYARLPSAGSDPAAGSAVTVGGWGTTSEGSNSSPADLRKVEVPVIDRTDCRSSYYSASEITNNMICAGIAAGGKDSCQGDSGGPLIDASKTLVGVVSWGSGCARPGKPGVYARVSNLLTFIRG